VNGKKGLWPAGQVGLFWPILLIVGGSMAVIGSVKAAVVGYDGERIYEDLALLASGIYGLLIGLVVL
jgi:hypothetical protein